MRCDLKQSFDNIGGKRDPGTWAAGLQKGNRAVLDAAPYRADGQPGQLA
jgi:hypothetical protein